MSATVRYQDDAADDRRSDHRTIFLVMIGLAMIPVIVYAAAVLVTWGKLPRGTHVAGVDVGGRTPAQAEELLRAALGPRTKAVVPLKAEEVAVEIDPTTAGLSVDYVKTIDGLAASSINPITVARSFSGRTDHNPELVVDDAAVTKAVVAFAKKVDKPKREGSVRFEGTTPVSIAPLVGRVLDREVAVKGLHERFVKLSTEAVEVPVSAIPVLTTQAEVDAAIAKIATPALSGPLNLVADGRSVEFPVSALATLISLKTDAKGSINLVVDNAKARALLLPPLKSFDAPSKDANVDVINGGPRIIPSINGRTADGDALLAAFPAALLRPAPREIPIPFTEIEPAVTTAKAKALGIKEVVSTFTTKYPCCKPRVSNIHTIARIVDGARVLPGETFSLNKFVGERDRARGFVEAPMIFDGALVPAVGGGVSQFATTTFNAVFFGGFKDVYHKPHSFYISRYPPGREATVSSPAPDLVWTNDSPYGVIIKTSYTDTSVTVTFWSTKRYDEVRAVPGPRLKPTLPTLIYRAPGPKCIPISTGVGGFDIVVYREFYKGGKQVKPRERFYTRYQPEHQTICGVAPVPVPPGTVPPTPPPPPGTTPPPATTPPPTTPPATPPPAKPANPKPPKKP